jgi:hypothetical protein
MGWLPLRSPLGRTGRLEEYILYSIRVLPNGGGDDRRVRWPL